MKNYNLIQLSSESTNAEDIPGYFKSIHEYKMNYYKQPKYFLSHEKLSSTFNYVIHAGDYQTFKELLDFHASYIKIKSNSSLISSIITDIACLEKFEPYLDYLMELNLDINSIPQKDKDILSKLFYFNRGHVVNYLTDKHNVPKILSGTNNYFNDILKYHELENIQELIDQGYVLENNYLYYYGLDNDSISNAIKIYQILPHNFSEEENIMNIFFGYNAKKLTLDSLTQLNDFFGYSFNHDYVNKRILLDSSFNYPLFHTNEHFHFYKENGLNFQLLLKSEKDSSFWNNLTNLIVIGKGQHAIKDILYNQYDYTIENDYFNRLIPAFMRYLQNDKANFEEFYQVLKFLKFDILTHTYSEFDLFFKERFKYDIIPAELKELSRIHIEKNQLNTTILNNTRISKHRI